MKCPECGCVIKNPVCVKGGQVKTAKGFSSPHVQALAQAARQRNKLLKESKDEGR